jgi:NAD-dependent dihydropyrimidine dehydrogenase PreA subunit
MTAMSSLTADAKRLAIDEGAVKVGIASPENLAGPPEADTEYVLPDARTVVSFLVVEPEDAVLKYLSKEDPQPYRKHFYDNLQTLGRVGLAVAERLKQEGHRAVALSPNGVYRPGSNAVDKLIPPFSHRYAAVAAGLGCIGWGGNVMTPEYGARILLSSVVTDAPLEPDSPLDENPCDRCKICINACPGGFMSKTETVTFTLGGREISHVKKGLHARCGISCGGFSGRGEGANWGTLAPSEPPIPKDDDELAALFGRLARETLQRAKDHPELPNFIRLSLEVPGYDQPGILARSEFDTAVTCGNCAIVCFETLEKRAHALKLLRTSGIMVEGPDGQLKVFKPQRREAATAKRGKDTTE